MHHNSNQLTSIVLCSDVVRQIVIQDKAKKTIKQSQVDFLVHFGKNSLHQDITFPFASFPYVAKVVDALTPLRVILVHALRKSWMNYLVDKQRRWLSILDNVQQEHKMTM